MTQLRYIVGVKLPDQDTVDRWLNWLRNGHIQEVMAGGAISATIFKMDDNDLSYEIDYRFPSPEVFANYEKHHAPRLREEGRLLFPPDQGIIYRRTTASLIEHFSEPS